ncbi:UTRA domain-containing protein [Stakelama saccharophila]|uniref:GntR family transcriptional regulator n=1 Tax=Stakelama saccharophila TaxID=3075605 RepID=A0ABZ0BA02_9SPHN|nr:UTRA domain-containing protein [Stakelama sp. W311]WNO54209.1 GntR family transcriptional regulator [Stakelama sp. W311]
MTAPLHERIRRDVEARILSGALGPGDRLPTEQALMADYGCARMTVSKALGALAAAGLIERRKRAGSFVARPETHSMMLDIPDLEGEVRGRGEAYAFHVTHRTVRRPRTAAERALGGQGELLVVEGIHRADDRPFAVEYRSISLNAVPEARTRDWAAPSPGAWLLAHVPWTEAESRVTAISADAKLADKLDVEPRAACLALDRRTWRGADGITSVRQIFAPGAIDLVARFGPDRRR